MKVWFSQNLFERRKDHEAARQEFRATLRIDPGHEHARKALERLTAPLRAAGDVVADHRRRDRPLLGRPDPIGVAVHHACSERT